MNWNEYEKSRFGEGVQQSFNAVQRQVQDLEEFLGIQPFPKFKRKAVFIRNKDIK